MTNSKLLSALLGGVAVGAALGVLLAPQAGADTRKQILKSTRSSVVSLDELIEEGKKTWYETKGKARMGAGIAADEMDEFMRHILDKGQGLWRKAKNKANDMADDAKRAANDVADDASGSFDSAMNYGKKSAYQVKESLT